MKKVFLTITALSLCTGVLLSQNINLLSGRYGDGDLMQLLIPHENWTPFPLIDDRKGWSAADREMIEAYAKKAEEYLDYEWPSIPATASLLYVREGDRNVYQKLSFGKRKALGTLLLGEIAENKGRFIDQIINGVWSICEESFWGVPAHLPGEVEGLANSADPIVDLFAAETATYLAWVDYFLGDKLDQVTTQIRSRIYNETQHRIFSPLKNKYHRWMGPTSSGRGPNNWNPWICSNWINTVLLLEKDQKKRAAHVHKALEVLDEFVNPYPDDGGCDEGPSYWGAAAASLYDNVSLLNLATNDAFDYVYKNDKFRKMGQFIYKAQISEKYFLNFADADPQPRMSASMIYRYGIDIEDEDMAQFGAYYWSGDREGEIPRFHFFRNFFELFIQEEISSTKKELPYPRDVWLPDLQVMAARDSEGTSDGFYLAAKGGHNDESHNHNDIGNFVVYYNGEPLLIDVGRGTYTRKTFSNRRYEIWYNCSDYHNLPTIGGITQRNGMDYKANRVEYEKSNKSVEFSLDIAKAYPDDENILRWARKVALIRGQSVQLVDAFRLRNTTGITEHLMTCYPPQIVAPGKVAIQLEAGDTTETFELNYDAEKYHADVEKIKLEAVEDQGIITKWGDRIYRINFRGKEKMRNGSFGLQLEKQ